MKITLSNHIEIITRADIEQQIIERFTFANPTYQEAVKFGRRTKGIDQWISLVGFSADGITAPLGTLGYLLENFTPDVIDQRATNPALIQFTGTLRPYQVAFIDQAIDAKGGMLVAATGAGKTVCGLALAARLQQRTLILVKSKDLAAQWQGAIKQFTGLESGLIGGGKHTEGEQFTIGMTQTLSKRDLSLLNYGLAIADECHNLPANQAYRVMNGLHCQYRYGLSATPQRRDNLEFMIECAIGGVCSQITQAQLQGNVLPVRVKTISIPFNANVDSWTGFLNALIDDENRNQMIINHAMKAAQSMGVIILCSQIRHCEILGTMLRDRDVTPLILHGQLPGKQRIERMRKAHEANLIIGTFSLLSEGVDLPHLKALIFAAPVSAAINKANPAATRLIQSIGRCRRPYKSLKKAYVLDIVDKCGFGVSAFKKRNTIYSQQGFEVQGN